MTDWLPTWYEAAFDGVRDAGIPRDSNVCAASPSTCCWSSLLPIQAWVQLHSVQRHGEECYMDKMAIDFICSNSCFYGCWIHLDEQSTIFTASCGWRYSDSGWKKSTILRVHYAGQFTVYSLRRVHLGSRSSGIGAGRPPFVISSNVGNLVSTRRQSFVVFLAVARSS